MLNFEFYNPTKVIFGRGAEMTAGKEIKALGGHKVLVHFGGSHLKKSGVLDRIHESLTEAGLTYVDLGLHQPRVCSHSGQEEESGLPLRGCIARRYCVHEEWFRRMLQDPSSAR